MMVCLSRTSTASNPVGPNRRVLTISTLHTLYFIIIVVVFTLSCCGVSTEETNNDGTEILINVEKIKQIGDPDVVLNTITRLALALNNCGVDVRGLTELQKVMLPAGSESRCMDGSPTGYYIRKKKGSRRWLIYLDGGYYCFDKKSCRSRAKNNPELISSSNWPHTKEGTGILSWSPEENPLMYSANIVFIPYCSSDAWSGNNTKSGFHFHGSTIIDEVVDDLIARQGFAEYGSEAESRDKHTKLFFSGSSAGATGVLLNIDRVADRIERAKPKRSISVFGIVDSGWFLDTDQFIEGDCTNTLNCSPEQSVQKGFRWWRPEIPKRCRRAYPDQPWRCFFGYRIYPYIKSPLFVITFLYDRAQILASMGGGYSTHREFQNDVYMTSNSNSKRQTFMKDLARLMNYTMTNVSAVFAASCMEHEILKSPTWHNVSIKGTKLVEALQCWEHSQQTTNRPRPVVDTEGSRNNDEIELITLIAQDLAKLTEAQESSSNRIRHTGQNRDSDNKNNRIGKHRNKSRQRRQRQRQRAVRNKIQRQKRDSGVDIDMNMIKTAMDSNLFRRYQKEQITQCKMKLYDDCDTPNCNLNCPNYLALFSNSHSNSQLEAKLKNSFSPDIEEIQNSVEDPKVLNEILSRQR